LTGREFDACSRFLAVQMLIEMTRLRTLDRFVQGTQVVVDVDSGRLVSLAFFHYCCEMIYVLSNVIAQQIFAVAFSCLFCIEIQLLLLSE